MKLMGILLRKSEYPGQDIRWLGSCGDWDLQVRRQRLGGQYFLQAKITQSTSWPEEGSEIGPILSPDSEATSAVLWFKTWALSEEAPSEELLQETLDTWFRAELQQLETKRQERVIAVTKFLSQIEKG